MSVRKWLRHLANGFANHLNEMDQREPKTAFLAMSSMCPT